MQRYHLIFLSLALTAACIDSDPAQTVVQDTAVTDVPIEVPDTATDDVPIEVPDAATDDVPIEVPDAEVDDVADTAVVVEKVPVDFLWVIDNTTSMCEEQPELQKGFKAFADKLAAAEGIDARVAVTTASTQCDNDGSAVTAAKGKFNQKAATTIPPSCTARHVRACASDADCADIDCDVYESCGETQDQWRCRTAQSEVCIENPNGSVNTSCTRSCETDAECQTLFGDTAYVCAGTPGSAACVRPPDTQSCPDELPAFVTTENLELFQCIASVGVTQVRCSGVSSPIQAAFMALDPAGDNAAQAAAFVRPDAYLVVVLVSDDDDCTFAADATVDLENSSRCSLLATTADGGPLSPVADYVTKFQALKTDPAKVVVAAFSGDSLKTDPSEATAEREAYVASKSSARTCFAGTSICNTGSAVADLGARLSEFAAAFGGAGQFSNICGESGLSTMLGAMADRAVELTE